MKSITVPQNSDWYFNFCCCKILLSTASLVCLASLFHGCAPPTERLQDEALIERRDQIRREVEKELASPQLALLGDQDYVIQSPELFTKATDEVMQSLEFRIGDDLELVRNQMHASISGVQRALLKSERGIAELERLIEHRFSNPKTSERVSKLEERVQTDLDRSIAHFGGLILSGRSVPSPTEPPQEFLEVTLDHGLLPSRLQTNSNAKSGSWPVCFVKQDNPWLDPEAYGSPARTVIAAMVLNDMIAHPNASRLTIRTSVLMPETITHWNFDVVRDPILPQSVTVTITTLNNDEASAHVVTRWTLPELEKVAESAPLSIGRKSK